MGLIVKIEIKQQNIIAWFSQKKFLAWLWQYTLNSKDILEFEMTHDLQSDKMKDGLA
jgi:hypothetical protein